MAHNRSAMRHERRIRERCIPPASRIIRRCISHTLHLSKPLAWMQYSLLEPSELRTRKGPATHLCLVSIACRSYEEKPDVAGPPRGTVGYHTWRRFDHVKKTIPPVVRRCIFHLSMEECILVCLLLSLLRITPAILLVPSGT